MKREEMLKIQDFFFEGMLKGYAANVKTVFKNLHISISDFPSSGDGIFHGCFCLQGAKCTVYAGNADKRRMRLIDLWISRKDSNFSSGFTGIWVDVEPVWMMHRGGSYPKEVIPFLKRVLGSTYSRKEFVGGRGSTPDYFDGYEYINDVTASEHRGFAAFSGRERIFFKRTPKNFEIAGFHQYFGGLLVPLED